MNYLMTQQRYGVQHVNSGSHLKLLCKVINLGKGKRGNKETLLIILTSQLLNSIALLKNYHSL